MGPFAGFELEVFAFAWAYFPVASGSLAWLVVGQRSADVLH